MTELDRSGYWDDVDPLPRAPRQLVLTSKHALATARGLFFILVIALAMVVGNHIEFGSPMPCHWEDEVLIGTGDFIQGHGWEGATCVPADDL